MRKRVGMGIMLAVAVVVAVCCQYFRERDAVLFQLEDGKPYISIRTVQSENKVYLWQEEEGEGVFSSPPVSTGIKSAWVIQARAA